MARRTSTSPGAVPPTGMRATRMRVGERDLVVLSYPLLPEGTVLTDAECEVLDAVLRGLRNAEIAAERGTTERTVSKQLDSLYRKLAVHSRAELAAKLQG